MTHIDYPPVVLFGYDASPFTTKVRLALKVKGVSYSYVPVPSMLPRPLLTSVFGLHYRKIPVLAIGREIYCDTSLIIEALEHFFSTSQGWGSVYPSCLDGVSEWRYRSLVRGFASFWTDKPLFRTTTGLIPSSIWASTFGKDRSQLIGHPLDVKKLAAKIPLNLSNLDLHLSLLEPAFQSGTWALPTKTPSLADISLYYQLKWGIDIAAGRLAYNLSGGQVKDIDTDTDVTGTVFNKDRYPGLWTWFLKFEAYIASLPDVEVKVEKSNVKWKTQLAQTSLLAQEKLLVPTPAGQHPSLDTQRGLVPGALVSVSPDDTGRDNPTVGTLIKIGVEELVIRPEGEAEMEVRVHFPRLGFVVKVVDGSKL